MKMCIGLERLKCWSNSSEIKYLFIFSRASVVIGVH